MAIEPARSAPCVVRSERVRLGREHARIRAVGEAQRRSATADPLIWAADLVLPAVSPVELRAGAVSFTANLFGDGETDSQDHVERGGAL
jgi:hypothetical protein